MRVALGSDHAGFVLKSAVAKHLADAGHEIVDLGTDSEEPVDYPGFCAATGRAVVTRDADLGIVFGGSGQGEQIAANKVHGVRAALCTSEFMARLAREHNDANVLALGSRILGDEFALRIVDAFMEASFEGGRHARRVGQLAEIEAQECVKASGRERKANE